MHLNSAWACLVTEANRGIIISEKPHFDPFEFDQHVKDERVYFFVRDEHSMFDCEYLVDTVFYEIYVFNQGGEGDIFRSISYR